VKGVYSIHVLNNTSLESGVIGAARLQIARVNYFGSPSLAQRQPLSGMWEINVQLYLWSSQKF